MSYSEIGKFSLFLHNSDLRYESKKTDFCGSGSRKPKCCRSNRSGSLALVIWGENYQFIKSTFLPIYPLYQSFNWPTSICNFLFINLFPIYTTTYQATNLSAIYYLPIYYLLSTYLPIYLSSFLPIYLSTYLFV